MRFLDLLRLRWRRQWRSGILLRMLALVLFGAFVGFFVGWIGLVFPETVAKSLPGRTPTRVLNEHLLTVFAGLVIIRFLVQRFDGDGWRPILSLPVARSVLARTIQITSAVSLLNLLPLVGLAALFSSTVVPAASTTGAVLWLAGALLALGTTHLAHTLLRAAWARRAWITVFGVTAAIVGLVGADLYGLAFAQDASSWLFGGLQRGRVLPLVVLGAATIGAGQWSTAALRRWTYHWVEGTNRNGRRRVLLDVRGRGSLSSLVLLEAKLMLRNRGPREQLLAGIVVVAFFVGLIMEGAIPTFSTAIAPFMLGLLLPVSYGQFAFAWHGGHFDGLLARVPPKRLVRATLLVIGGLGVGPLLLAVPVVGWVDPFFAVPMLAFALYHAGVTAPVMVGTSILWNRQWVNPEQSRFTVAGGGPLRGFVLMPLLGVPPVLLHVAGGGTAMLLGVAGLGIAGLATGPLWLPLLEAALRHRRHAMLRGFRGGWISPHEWHW